MPRLPLGQRFARVAARAVLVRTRSNGLLAPLARASVYQALRMGALQAHQVGDHFFQGMVMLRRIRVAMLPHFGDDYVRWQRCSISVSDAT